MTVSVIDALLKSVFYLLGRPLGGYRLKPFERSILQEMVSCLPSEASCRMNEQLVVLKCATHWFGGQSVEFSIRRGLQLPPTSVGFHFMPENVFPLASARVAAIGVEGDRQVRVDLFVLRGFICALEFERKPRDVFRLRNPDRASLVISDVHVLFDPMDANPFPCEHTSSLEVLPVWIRSLLGSRECAALWGPLREEDRSRIVDYYDLVFPQDYLDFIATCEYLKCDELIEILGPSQAWVYVTPHEYVIKLADIIGYGALCLLRNREPGLYYIDNEDHIPIPVGNSFREAVEKALTDGVQDWNDRCEDFI
jgi:hypothetical protein